MGSGLRYGLTIDLPLWCASLFFQRKQCTKHALHRTQECASKVSSSANGLCVQLQLTTVVLTCNTLLSEFISSVTCTCPHTSHLLFPFRRMRAHCFLPSATYAAQQRRQEANPRCEYAGLCDRLAITMSLMFPAISLLSLSHTMRVACGLPPVVGKGCRADCSSLSSSLSISTNSPKCRAATTVSRRRTSNVCDMHRPFSVSWVSTRRISYKKRQALDHLTVRYTVLYGFCTWFAHSFAAAAGFGWW